MSKGRPHGLPYSDGGRAKVKVSVVNSIMLPPPTCTDEQEVAHSVVVLVGVVVEGIVRGAEVHILDADGDLGVRLPWFQYPQVLAVGTILEVSIWIFWGV